LVLQRGTSRNTLNVGTKTVKLRPSKMTAVSSLCLHVVNKSILQVFKEFVFSVLLGPGLYSDKAWFTLSRYVNSQNTRYWFTENIMQFV